MTEQQRGGLVRIFFTGMLVSFLGSLPLGTLNIAAMQIAISQSVKNALLFSLGSLTAEVVYVRLSLVAMDWVRKQEKILRLLEWLTLVIIAALAVASLYAAMHPSQGNNVILNNSLPSYLLGLTMSAVNPVQIPFWFGWSTVLFTKNVLKPKVSYYNFYIVGIGLGTLMGNCVFIFGGRLIANKIQNNQSLMNYIIGGVFVVTALIQCWRMFIKKKDIAAKLHETEKKQE
ncbi:LysE family translocator [Niabella hirudinis]|uniref:LysE family translocator n=1 Tax=Niabella hirudinis TaxID=1285929 RepID=UPI003EBE8B1B